MTTFIAIAAIVGAVVGLILILPCNACRARRERLKAAYAEWRRQQSHNHD